MSTSRKRLFQRQILRPTNVLLLLLCTIAFLAVLGTKAAERDAAAAAASPALQQKNGTADPATKAAGMQPPPSLVSAIRAEQLDSVRTLLKEAEDRGTKDSIINEEYEKGITPLIEATLTGNIELVKLLLTAGAPAMPPPGFRHTPLRAAALPGSVELIQLFLREGADPNSLSDGDRTPLMGSCFLRPGYPDELSLPAVEALLKDKRTDPTIANTFGETALDLCKQRKYDESVKRIEESIARREDKKRLRLRR